MSYLDVLILFILPVLAASVRWWLAAGDDRERRRFGWEAIVAIVVVANLWTTPWDNLMVIEQVWTYDPGVVMGTIWHIPLEEQLFFSLQTLLTGAFALFLSRKHVASSPRDNPHVRVFALLVLAVAMTTAACLIEQRQAFYLTTMVVWFGLPLGIQFFYGADIIWRHRRVSIPAILIPTVYLCALDRMAMGAGVWNIEDATSVGLEVFGLPIEEAIFFTLTNVLVVQGVLLYVHVRQHGWRRTS